MIEGQINLRDAIRRQVDFESNGKQYKLSPNPAVLIVRPRGWHLDEPRITVDKVPVSGSLFDFGLYFYHNAKELVKRGHAAQYYQSHRFDRNSPRRFPNGRDPFRAEKPFLWVELWPVSSSRFLHRDIRIHCTRRRWDYIFSFIKKRRADRSAILPDRKDVTMEVAFMDAYVRLLIQTCHR